MKLLRWSSNSYTTALGVAIGSWLLLSATTMGQAKNYPLDSASGLRLQNVLAQPAVLQGKKGLRVATDDASRKKSGRAEITQSTRTDGLECAYCTSEAESAGSPIEGASAG